MGRRELKESLGTKDQREARAKAPAVLARWEALLDAARKGSSPPLTLTQIDSVIGTWYLAETARHADDPGPAEAWDERGSYYAGMWQQRCEH